MANLLSFNNEVFSSFAFCSGAVLVKTLLMAPLTAFHRMTKNVFANEEDCQRRSRGSEKLKPILNDPSVERVRRNHLNDLENVLPFAMLGVLYVMTNPDPWTAKMHFRVFMAARLLHTLCYQIPIPQPSRALTFFVGIIVCMSMGVQVLRAGKF